jgi:RNA-directed DNA polymerase
MQQERNQSHQVEVKLQEDRHGAEAKMKDPRKENQIDESLLEEVLEGSNLRVALKRVKRNKGGAGVDGMTVEELPKFLKDNWLTIKEALLAGMYKPAPVKRVEIPKPDGGARKLGIPTVLDRFIQQALMQVLQKKWDETFSKHSYGFRPGKSAHQAVAEAQQYIKEGYNWVVDIDLEKFFDGVNHDRLMSKCAERIRDRRTLKLISSYRKAGVLENGLVSPSEKGTPNTLKLKVNEQKSAIDRPWNRKILGFSFAKVGTIVKRKPAPKSIERFKNTVREITSRSKGRSREQVVQMLSSFLIGWRNYFGFSEVKSVFKELDSWIRRKLRCMLWKQWGKRQYRELRAGGVECFTAWVTAKSGHGPWRISHSPAVQRVLNNKFFEKLTLPSLVIAR